MGCECLKCNNDVSELMNFDTLCEDFIECPNCGNKMTVEFDESWDEESGDEYHYWWLEQFKEI